MVIVCSTSRTVRLLWLLLMSSTSLTVLTVGLCFSGSGFILTSGVFVFGGVIFPVLSTRNGLRPVLVVGSSSPLSNRSVTRVGATVVASASCNSRRVLVLMLMTWLVLPRRLSGARLVDGPGSGGCKSAPVLLVRGGGLSGAACAPQSRIGG